MLYLSSAPLTNKTQVCFFDRLMTQLSKMAMDKQASNFHDLKF